MRFLLIILIIVLLIVNEGEKQEDEFSGKSASFEETLKNMMTSHELSDNPILADRLLKLITEVHSLHNSS